MKIEWKLRRAAALWARTPSSSLEVALLWSLGIAAGLLLFRASLSLPLPGALAGWAGLIGFGLLLARQAEPMLWEAPRVAAPDDRDAEPAPPPAPPN